MLGADGAHDLPMRRTGQPVPSRGNCALPCQSGGWICFGLPGARRREEEAAEGFGGTRQNEKAPALSRWSLQILMRALAHRPTFPQHRQSTGCGARYRNSPGY